MQEFPREWGKVAHGRALANPSWWGPQKGPTKQGFPARTTWRFPSMPCIRGGGLGVALAIRIVTQARSNSSGNGNSNSSSTSNSTSTNTSISTTTRRSTSTRTSTSRNTTTSTSSFACSSSFCADHMSQCVCLVWLQASDFSYGFVGLVSNIIIFIWFGSGFKHIMFHMALWVWFQTS